MRPGSKALKAPCSQQCLVGGGANPLGPTVVLCGAQVADFGLARALQVQTRVETATYGTVTHSATLRRKPLRFHCGHARSGTPMCFDRSRQ